MKKRGSFTLIEFVILIAVFGILASIFMPTQFNRVTAIKSIIKKGGMLSETDMIFYRANKNMFVFPETEDVLADISEVSTVPMDRIEIFCLGNFKGMAFAKTFAVATQADFENDIKTRTLTIRQGWDEHGVPFNNLRVNNYSYCQATHIEPNAPDHD